MITDAKNTFASSQAVTTSAVGTNTIDLAVANSIGSGEPMGVVFVVNVAADQTSGDEDYTFDVEYATDDGQTTGRQLIGRRVFESGTPTAPAQDADLLVAAFQFVIPVPPVTGAEDAQYIGVRTTTAGTSPSVTISAYLQPMSMISTSDITYPNNYTIV